MVKKLVSKTQFAEMAGVSAAAVTKASKSGLSAAMEGKRVDAAHPDAVAYIENQERKRLLPAAPGLDPLYEQAIELCRETGNWGQNHLIRSLDIGRLRAKRIRTQMEAAGLVPDPTKAPPKPKPAPKKPHVRGTEAARETKKRQLSPAPTHAAPPPTPIDPPALVETTVPPGLQQCEIPGNIAKYADMKLRDIIYQFGTDVALVDYLKAVKSIEDITEKRLKNAERTGELISRHIVSEGLIATLDGTFTKMLTDGAKTISVRASSMAATGATPIEIEEMVSKQLGTFIRPAKAKMKRVLENA